MTTDEIPPGMPPLGDVPPPLDEPPRSSDDAPGGRVLPFRRGTAPRAFKQLPHNLDAEGAVLGGILLHPDVLQRIPELESADFYDPRHKAVWAAMLNVVEQEQPIDLTTLEVELQRAGKYEAVGGVGFLGELALRVPAAENVPHYAGIIRKFRRARDAAVGLADIVAKITDGEIDADEAVALGQRTIADVIAFGTAPTRRSKPVRDLLGSIRVEAARPIVTTGIRELDEYAKIRAGSYVVLVGGPGAGKTSFALGRAVHHARNTGPCVFLSAELADFELGARMIAQHTKISWSQALDGDFEDRVGLEALAIPRLVTLNDEHATLDELERELNFLVEEYPGQTPLVVLDYIQLIALTAPGREMRDRMIGVVERTRRIAKKYHAAVLALSQTSRNSSVQIKAGEMLGADAMGSGAESAQIERAAHIHLTLGSPTEKEDGTSAIDLSIAKVRAGRGDRVLPLIYDGRTGDYWAAGGIVAPDTIREQRSEAKESKKVHSAVLGVEATLAKARVPISRNELAQTLGSKREHILAAVKKLLEAGTIVEVNIKAKGGSKPLWTRERAVAAGVPIVGAEGALA